jgi:membrane protein YqaA with SNARE-associated domain
MKDFLAALVALGPGGLMVAALLDGAGLPIPGGVDALLIYLSSQMPADAYMLAAVCVLGSLLGNMLLFLLARRGGERYLSKRSASKRSKRFRTWFDHYGLLTVFIAALVPLPVMPLKIFVLCAGALGSTTTAFVATFVGARLARYFGLAYLGKNIGADAILYLRTHAWHLAGFAVALFLVLVMLVKIADRRRAARMSA